MILSLELTVNFFEFFVSELSVCESGTLIPKSLLLLVGVVGMLAFVVGVLDGFGILNWKENKI